MRYMFGSGLAYIFILFGEMVFLGKDFDNESNVYVLGGDNFIVVFVKSCLKWWKMYSERKNLKIKKFFYLLF